MMPRVRAMRRPMKILSLSPKTKLVHPHRSPKKGRTLGFGSSPRAI